MPSTPPPDIRDPRIALNILSAQAVHAGFVRAEEQESYERDRARGAAAGWASLTVEHAAKQRPGVAFAPRGELVAGIVSLPEVRDEHLADGVGAGAAKAKLLELMPEGSDNNRRAESVQCDGRAWQGADRAESTAEHRRSKTSWRSSA